MLRKGRVATVVPAVVLAVGALAGCQLGGSPGSGGSATAPPEITNHEGGPESPIMDGLIVPEGAVQLGPLVRLRSDRVIDAYQPDLTVALARQGVSDAVSAAQANRDGVLRPSPPAITKNGRPDDDTFALLEDPPPADVTVALIRLGDPGPAVRSMAEQIARLLPDADVEADDLASYCTIEDDRVTGCTLDVEGVTDDDRRLAISMAVDPGDLATRTAPPSSLTQPVMQLRVEDLSDPRLERSAGDSADTEESEAEPTDPPAGAEADDVIWPRMDVAAPVDTPLLNGWVAPDDAVLLLSSFSPSFATLYVPSAGEAREVAESYVASLSPDAVVRSDSYEGLNEVDVTFTAVAPDGSRAMATHVTTARGNYVALFYTPAS